MTNPEHTKFWFEEGDSAVYRLLELTHDIYPGMVDRKRTCAVFLDIRKTFDTSLL